MTDILFAAAGGYLLGSVPFGLVLCGIFGYGDIRKIGSGNIGVTNVLRTGNKGLALLTLLLDSGKGAGAVLLARWLFGDDAALVAAVASILGHTFPLWLKFKGGKGVATTLGVFLATRPLVGVTACLIWLFMAVLFRYSSLAALVAVLSAPAAAYIFYHEPAVSLVCGLIAAFVWIRHKANIDRLLRHCEPRIGDHSKKEKEEEQTASSPEHAGGSA